ncbi:hypothetical protein [Campylobacter rectus]|uniref:Uncharacterized protein n=1 Tax=Campylobacter rectus TaxID=203 RepID=A0A6G5QLB1_CAMRE|nr:hypothetical protein [Campylobacter rectus]QCD46495.1 hypothetical protein CRECT_0816 [Campylobacter rectus]UEB47194.1 hypothetical protein LK437_09305 [Campylobacter rectus]
MKATAIVMSIHEPSSGMLVSGEKNIIHRKHKFSKEFKKIYVYCPDTAKIVGELEVGGILYSASDGSCISRSRFYDYYDSEMVYAIKIKRAIKYEPPKEPLEIDPNFRAPQQFYYIN